MIAVISCRHRRERDALEEVHKREIEEFYTNRNLRHQTKCPKCNHTQVGEANINYPTDSSRPQTPGNDEETTFQLRNIVSKLRGLTEPSAINKKEQLENIDQELFFVQKYLSSGRPYPRGQVPSPMTRNTFSFSQQQPNSDTVQTIVKTVLTAGHERENLIKPGQFDIPESVFEPHNKKAQNNLDQVMSSVRQMMKQQMICPKSHPASQTSVEQVQRIKDQVMSSHRSIREGLQRSQAHSFKDGSNAEHKSQSFLQASSRKDGVQSVSQRQREIQDELSHNKPLIEKVLQQQHSSSKPKEPT